MNCVRPPNRFAVYHRILKNICDNIYRLIRKNVTCSKIFPDILQCRLRRGSLKLYGNGP